MTFASGVFLIKIPAINAPMIAVSPMFSANAAKKKHVPNPKVSAIIGAWRFVFFLAVYLMTRYPMMTVRIKNSEICKRRISELPAPKTNAKRIIATTSLTMSAVRIVNPMRDERESMSERTRIAMVVDVAVNMVPIAIHWIRER